MESFFTHLHNQLHLPNNCLHQYKKIIPCGIKDKEVSNLKLIKNQNYMRIKDEIVLNFIKNLEKKVF